MTTEFDPRRAGGDEYAPQPSSRPFPAAHNPAAPRALAPPLPDLAEILARRAREDELLRQAGIDLAVSAPEAPVQPPAPSPAAPALKPGEVVLSRAYRAHDIEVSRITLRAPVGRDIKAIGNPVKLRFDATGRIEDIDMHYDRVMQYIVMLASPPLPPSTVDEFAFDDIDACAGVLAPFFVKLVPTVR
jgi:hypothetical protein